MKANQTMSSAQQTTYLYKYNESTKTYTRVSTGTYYYPSITLNSGSSYSLSFQFSNLEDGKYHFDIRVGTYSGGEIVSPIYSNDIYAYTIGTTTGIRGITIDGPTDSSTVVV